MRLERKAREAASDARRHKRNLARKRREEEDDELYGREGGGKDAKYELNTVKMGKGIFYRHVPSSDDDDDDEDEDHDDDDDDDNE